ncbi:TPA: hypothetical protein DIV49_02355 [Candidatus Saccharibacteria bacterium]|nr:hypothetical protein [Candidatus Saccharibacteria bacterium]
MEVNLAMSGFAKTLLVILVCLVMALGASAGVYYWQQQKIDTLRDKNTNLTSDINELENQVNAGKTPTTTAATNEYTSRKGVKLVVYTPTKGEQVSSPLYVSGKVPGSWSFEASFPIKLVDETGNVIAQGQATLLDDWMTSALVPFNAKLSWTTARKGALSLVLEKDNPSGMSSNEDSLTIQLK